MGTHKIFTRKTVMDVRLHALLDENIRLKAEIDKLQRQVPTWREIREFTKSRTNAN